VKRAAAAASVGICCNEVPFEYQLQNQCSKVNVVLCVKDKRLKLNKALNEIPILELRGVTCHMGSHSITCHPTQVNAPSFTPASKLVLDLPTPEGWKAELT